jgi:hypothetical protein
MKCKACDHSELKARITLTRDVPLAARGGNIKVGGVKVSQLDLKEVWETEAFEDGSTQERALRGPIFCSSCGAEHFYVVRAKDPLLLGSYDEAVELGAESFLEA